MSEFLKKTGEQYDALKQRYARKKLPTIPFSRDEYREHVRAALGRAGVLRCRYCHGWFGVMSITGDHAVPRMRQGSLGLENIEFVCAGCNQRKGGLLPEEYNSLLAFLDTVHPMARRDILSRLQMAVKLAAAGRWRERRRA